MVSRKPKATNWWASEQDVQRREYPTVVWPRGIRSDGASVRRFREAWRVFAFLVLILSCRDRDFTGVMLLPLPNRPFSRSLARFLVPKGYVPIPSPHPLMELYENRT